jgi:hypothetical protein
MNKYIGDTPIERNPEFITEEEKTMTHTLFPLLSEEEMMVHALFPNVPSKYIKKTKKAKK